MARLNYNEVITLDFETERIEDRPAFPPQPVGLAVKDGGRKAHYYSFFHRKGFPDGRNKYNPTQVREVLVKALESNRPLLFHHGKFDLSIITEHFMLPMPDWRRVHDTMLLAYLDHPHERDLGLKPLCGKYLDRQPLERDELKKWILENIEGAKKRPKEWGAWISHCPAPVVDPYACSDVDSTFELFKYLFPRVVGAAEMGVPYARELRMIEPMLENERRGVRVDYDELVADNLRYSKQFDSVDQWIRKKLKAPELEIDKNDQLVEALLRSGFCNEKDFLRTPKTGEISTSKESLAAGVKDPVLVAVLEYRATLATCMRTFMQPWELSAAATSLRRVHFEWNSTKQPENGGGTRTGRMSSSPNAQNIPTDENIEKAERGVLKHKLKFEPLPRVRRYIVADSKDHVLCDRDFSQQELRMLAHFEYADMRDAYVENPELDLHTYAAQLIQEKTGIILDPDPGRARKITKTIAFGLLYGLGAGNLAIKLGTDVKKAEAVKKAYLGTFPGVDQLMRDLKFRGRTGDFMTTWGGRRYYCEPPRVINGSLRSFEYKLINYLIQGSSADFTKEAMLRYWDMRENGRFIMTVHDQLITCAPREHRVREMEILRCAMNDVPGLDVPMLSDGEWGYRWYDMEECA